MRPDIDDVQPHEGRQADGRFHVVGEDEEGTACGNYAAVQSHTVHDAGHGELADAHLEELSGEVAFGEGFRLFEEAVRLVRVAEVGRGDYHVAYLFREYAQHLGGCRPRSDILAGVYRIEIYLGEFAAEEGIELSGEFRTFTAPFGLLFLHPGHPVVQLFRTCLVQFAALREDGERVVGIAAEVADGCGDVCTGSRERLSVGRYLVLETFAVRSAGPFPHDGPADDEGGAFGLPARCSQRFAYLVGVVTVYADDVPAPCTVFACDVLVHDLLDSG